MRLCVGPGGRPRLWVRGRSFYAAHTMRSGVVRWRCTMGGCGCKAYTQKGTLHKLVGEHNHTGRCGRRPPNLNPPTQLITSISTPPSGSASPPTPLLVPRLPNFDPNAWIVRYQYLLSQKKIDVRLISRKQQSVPTRGTRICFHLHSDVEEKMIF